MHAGGANTTLKNNRNLLKKRKTMFRRRSDVFSLTDDKIKKDNKKRLVTMSASERRAIGRNLRIRHRIEFAVIMILIVGTFLWFFL